MCIRDSSNRISASIKLQMIQQDFADLLSLGSASFTSENNSQIDWLRWLLLEGDTIIITNYNFILGPNPASRTGGGIMRKNGAGSWRVPPEYAGTVQNNWITRGLDASVNEINEFINRLTS